MKTSQKISLGCSLVILLLVLLISVAGGYYAYILISPTMGKVAMIAAIITATIIYFAVLTFLKRIVEAVGATFKAINKRR